MIALVGETTGHQKAVVSVQVLTGGGSFADCVPKGLDPNAPVPDALMQRLPLQQRFIRYIRDADAYAIMHGRQYFSNITNLTVRC